MHNTGHCHCGQISFSIEGEPLRMAQCHCGACRRISGTGHASNAFFNKSQITIKGEPAIYAYTADSGRVRHRLFCPNCGSRLFTSGPNNPDVMGVHVGVIDNTDWFKAEIIYYDHERPIWDMMDPEIPRQPQAAK